MQQEQQQPTTTAASPTTDPIFKQGLSSILAPYHERGASPEEIQAVTDRAWEFYTASQAPAPASTDSTPSAPAPAAPATDDPPYPLSFAALAQLIASGAPIPGIKEIPDKLSEEEPSVSKVDVGMVKKPWEK